LSAVAALVALAACANPVGTTVAAGGVPAGAKNAVTIQINGGTGRSGLVSVGTASLRADVYDILLYNATKTYRAVVSGSSGSAVLTDLVPGTYGLLVLAGKSNGATTYWGQPAALVLGSGDIPYLTNGTLAGAPAGLTGTGVVVPASGNTVANVSIQNIVYSITATGTTGSNPYSVPLNSAFTVTYTWDLFLNQTTYGSLAGAPISFSFAASSLTGSTYNLFDITGGASFVSTDFPSVSILGTSRGIHPVSITGNFVSPGSGGTSQISFGSAWTGGFAKVGEVMFYNPLDSSASPVDFSSIPTQSGLAYDWYVPSSSYLTTAMAGITDSNGAPVPGAATVNFSGPSATVTVGWGSGL
jgi:hypothetical protein